MLQFTLNLNLFSKFLSLHYIDLSNLIDLHLTDGQKIDLNCVCGRQRKNPFRILLKFLVLKVQISKP